MKKNLTIYFKKIVRAIFKSNNFAKKNSSPKTKLKTLPRKTPAQNKEKKHYTPNSTQDLQQPYPYIHISIKIKI